MITLRRINASRAYQNFNSNSSTSISYRKPTILTIEVANAKFTLPSELLGKKLLSQNVAPFCGSLSQEIYDLYYDGPHRLIYCKCGAQAGEAENELEAIVLWNSRTLLAPLEPYQYLPCPFCGGSEQEEYQQGKYCWLWCKCGAQGSHARDKEGAITAWNTRSRDRTLEKNQ